MINYWWKLKFTVQLIILLIVNPEVDWIPGILNVFKVGVFVTATVCELFWTNEVLLLYLSCNFLYKNQLDSFTIFPGLCREVYFTGQ
jgi:hypothetical protein